MGVAPYRVLIVGCGRIAGINAQPDGDGPVLCHADAYFRDPRFELAACVEPNTEKRSRFVNAWRLRESYASLKEAFSGGLKYDVVSLCAPTKDHATMLEILSGSPVRLVFAEKPLLASKDEEAVLARFDKTGSPVVMVNYTRRWDPVMGSLRDAIQSGQWGRCRSVALHYNRGVRNNASHGVQLVTWLLALDAGELTIDGIGCWRSDGNDGDPTVDAIVSAPGGLPIHLIGGDARDFSMFEIVLTMERGVAEIRDGGWRVVTRLAHPSEKFPGYRELQQSDVREGGYAAAFPAALDNIVECIEGAAQPGCGREEALAIEVFCQRLGEAALFRPEKEIRT